MSPRMRWPTLGRRAVAAAEFALCAPVLIFLVIGTIEISLLYRTEAKLNWLTASFAEMVANQEIAQVDASGVTQAHSPVPTTGSAPASLSDLCSGAILGLQPLPPNGLTIAVASVTETAAAHAATQSAPATAASYDEWEVDLDRNCSPTGTQSIGLNGGAGALTLAKGNGGSTALLQTQGDNVIIVRANLQYPGTLGLFITAIQTLSQSALARWRYASATNVTSLSTTPAPAATLEFSCSGTGCVSNNGV